MTHKLDDYRTCTEKRQKIAKVIENSTSIENKAKKKPEINSNNNQREQTHKS